MHLIFVVDVTVCRAWPDHIILNFFFFFFCVDLAVGLINVLTDIIWKMTVAWYAGNIACKVVRFFQVSSSDKSRDTLNYLHIISTKL